jgi:hypothetical protein
MGSRIIFAACLILLQIRCTAQLIPLPDVLEQLF